MLGYLVINKVNFYTWIILINYIEFDDVGTFKLL